MIRVQPVSVESWLMVGVGAGRWGVIELFAPPLLGASPQPGVVDQEQWLLLIPQEEGLELAGLVNERANSSH
jgi:hypothetical protein